MSTLRTRLCVCLAAWPAWVCFAQELPDSVGEEQYVGVRYEVQPSFAGGFSALQAYLGKNLRQIEGIERAVKASSIYITFLVDVDGSIRDAKILRGVHPLLDEEALRVVQAMPPWEPATLFGEAIPMHYHQAIRFEHCIGR